jgi:hypothetical protein
VVEIEESLSEFAGACHAIVLLTLAALRSAHGGREGRQVEVVAPHLDLAVRHLEHTRAGQVDGFVAGELARHLVGVEP